MLKRLFSIITISLVLTGSFFSAYNIKCPVYADSTTDQWTQVTTNQQLVEAFKYYCKSRDLTIEGSIADGVTSFTTKAFNSACKTLGIDVTALQAQIKYQTDGNTGLRFLFSATGVNAFNRIFAQFLQDNDLSVGSAYDIELYSGFLFYDTSGTAHLGWITSSYSTSSNNLTDIVYSKGDYYLYDGIDCASFYNNGVTSVSVNLNNKRTVSEAVNNFDIPVFRRVKDNDSYYYGFGSNNDAHLIYGDDIYDGGLIVIKMYGTNNYYLCTFRYANNDSTHFVNSYDISSISQIYFHNTDDIESATITINTYNKVINNNNYEGDTIINNEGDVINNYPDPNPDPTPNPPSIPDSDGWQDFTLPEMPNDWLIYGMERKFPFDIPFNIMFALSLLNHEPEIPKFEGDIDLKVCTWHYDIDLSPFDDIATILRRFEVLAFIIGLAILTKNLIDWG